MRIPKGSFMKSKKVLVFLASLFLAAAVVYAGGKKDGGAASEGKVIYVGAGNNYEPYWYLDAQGNLIGYEKALLDEIDKRLPQYSFLYEQLSFQNITVALGQNKVDIGAHEFESNPQRREAWLFSEEGYNDYDNWLLVQSGGKWENIKTFDDIAGNPAAQLAVTIGSNREAYLKSWNASHAADKQIASIAYDSSAGTNILYQDIINGKTVGTFTILNEMKRANALIPGLKLISRGDKPVTESKAYYLFRKDSAQLRDDVDKALREIKADGTFAKIYKREIDDYYNNLGNR
jgi:L-cystine transport system substrate-binding protein